MLLLYAIVIGLLQGFTEHVEFLTALYNTKGGRNQSRVEDPEIVKDVSAIEQELDTQKRFAMTKARRQKRRNDVDTADDPA